MVAAVASTADTLPQWPWLKVISFVSFLATTSLFVATCLPFSHVHLVSPPGHLIPSHCSLLFTLHPKSLHVFPWSVRSFSAVIKAFHNAFHCHWHLLHTLHVLAGLIPSTFLHTYIFVAMCSFCIVCVSHMYASIELVLLTLCPWIILLHLSASVPIIGLTWEVVSVLALCCWWIVSSASLIVW